MEKAYLAGGCFWGVEYYLQKLPGVVSTRVGYMGGTVSKPTYKQVCSGRTGHAETIEVVFNSDRLSYEDVVKLFLEIHDPTQIDRQGPDVGSQYRSEIFYVNDEQKQVAESLLNRLQEKGLAVVTKLTSATDFWEAEDYHQKYYAKNGQEPYCHRRVKRF